MSQLLALKKIPHSLQSWLKLTSLAYVIYWVSTGVRGQVAGRMNSSILNQLQLSVEKRKFEFAADGNWKFFGSTFRLFCHCRKKVSAAASTHWFEKKEITVDDTGPPLRHLIGRAHWMPMKCSASQNDRSLYWIEFFAKNCAVLEGLWMKSSE